MKSALIGYTGFIGSNLAKQYKFTDLYNSKNIKSIESKKYDLIVSAATKAERWWANQNSEEDWKGIKKLLDNLKSVHTKHFVLISTVDVYPNPNGANEDYPIKSADLKQAYGLNRFKMENFIRKHFPKVTVLRLPQTYGAGLKKNFVYDLIHDNALDFTHKDSLLQLYNLDNLWKDIKKAVVSNISVANMAVEPVTARELAKYTLGIDFKTVTQSPPFSYNMITKYGKYLYKKSVVLKELKKFIAMERAKTKIAISNLSWNKNEDQAIVSLLKKYQITGIEIAPTKIWGDPTKINRSEAEEYKSFWSKNGIKIVATASLLFGHPELTIFENEKTRKKTLNHLKKMIRLSHYLGATAMVFGSPKNRVVGNLDKTLIETIAIKFFTEIAQEAKKYNIYFGIEANPKMYGTDFINTTKDAVSLVKNVNHENFRVHLDIGTMIVNKENFENTLKLAIPYSCHLHISEPGLEPIPLTKSNHIKITKILKKLKYEKWASIEMPLNESPDNVNLIENALKFITNTYR